MGDFFDTMTIVVVIIMVFIVLVIAIHASARLIQMTFGRKSGLKQKDTAKSNEAVKNAEPVNLPEPEQKKESPGIDERCAIYKKKYLTCKPLAKRAQVCIEQENACIIKYMLLVIDPKATMSGYINNIVDEHLKLYEEKKADYGN